MANEGSYVSYASAAVAVAAVPLSFFGPGGLRLAVIGLLMLAGPGTALVLLLRLDPPRSIQAPGALPLGVAVAIALSLTMSTLMATGMIHAGLWSPQVGVCVLAAATLGVLGCGFKRPRSAAAGAK